jgi:hypothetical protein
VRKAGKKEHATTMRASLMVEYTELADMSHNLNEELHDTAKDKNGRLEQRNTLPNT